MVKYFFIPVLMFCSLFIEQCAANLSNYYTSDNGLLNNNVNCIMQDHKGYIWMGTTDGVVRFNGYEFASYFHSDDSASIIGAEILDIFEDQKSNIWISTALGLSCFDAKSKLFRNFTAFRDSFAYSNYITGVLNATNGNLWVATSYGIHLFNPRSGKFKIFTFRHQSLSESDANYVRKMVKDKNGNLWLGLINGELVHFNTQNYTYQIYTQHISSATASKLDFRLTSLVVDANNAVWAGFRNRGLVNYSSSGVLLHELTQQNGLLPTNSILCLSTANDSSLLVGTNGNGIVCLKNNRLIALPLEYKQTASSKVSGIFCDRQGNRWFAYVSAGIEVFYAQHNQFASNYCFDSSSPKNKTVLAVCIDHQDRLWLACDAAGLFCIDRRLKKTTRYFKELKNNFPATNEAVTSVYEDKNGIIWVGSYTGGLSAIHPTGKIVNYRNQSNNTRSIAGNSIKDITSDKQGNIWLAIDNRGFSMLNPKTDLFRNYNIDSMFGSSWKNWVYHIIHRDSIVLITTNDGIVVYNLQTGKARNYLADSEVKNKYRVGVIPFAYFDKKNRLWVASKNGLLRFDIRENKLVTFSMKNGFSANAISSIAEDAFGNLWLGTFRGLIRFNPETRMVNNFTIQDGLQSNQFNYGACCVSQQGELLFGGTNGYTSFLPQNIRLNPFRPPVDINSFRISNIEMYPNTKDSPLQYDISCTDTIVLQYNQANIGFSFTALNLFQSDKNKYAYQLKGFDTDWIQAGTNRQANYTNLPSGNYVFAAKASNNDGLWNETGRSIVVIITPPFWRSPWAYLFYGILIVILLYFFRRYSIITINEKHRLQLEGIEKEKQDEIHRNKLAFFTEISHEIRTPLTLIIDPIERHLDANSGISAIQLKSIYNNIKKLHNLVNQLLDFRKIEASPSLHYSVTDVVEFVKKCISNFETYSLEKHITIQLQSSLEHFPFLCDAEKMETILSNLLTNALKHTPAKGSITVLLESKQMHSQTYLNLVVENTGKGIAPEHLSNLFNSFYKADSYTEGSGLGLAIVKTLVELHNGTIAVECLDNKLVRFSMLFPVQNDETLQTNFIDQTATSVNGAQKPLLLVAEDNAEVRNYISRIFAQNFQIIEAENGQEAWIKAQDTLPDIIISDVMMPLMDGRELCQKLKTNTLTNHIPLILLTAQTLDSQKLSGLASGADDYICKPFRSRELELKVQNLLATQNNLKQRLKQQFLQADASEQIYSHDDEFLKQAHAVIQQHLSESNFDIEQFASEMCLSSRQLRRKLQAIIGISPVEMLRNTRLQAALPLLKQHKYQVSEVAYMVGFDDPKYFSKLFSKQFGVLPSEV